MGNIIEGILIDPKSRSISGVKLERGDYLRIPELLGCEIFTTFAFPNGDTAYLDDEGLIRGNKHLEEVGCYRLNWANQSHLAGKTLVLGVDMEGESISCRSTIGELENQISWVSVPSATQLDNLLDIKVFSMDDWVERGFRF